LLAHLGHELLGMFLNAGNDLFEFICLSKLVFLNTALDFILITIVLHEYLIEGHDLFTFHNHSNLLGLNLALLSSKLHLDAEFNFFLFELFDNL
jgi:hypothetical protein